MTSTVTKNVFESLAAGISDLDFDQAAYGTGTVKEPLDRRVKDRLRANVALAAATALTPANERFDPVRFIRACGVSSGTLSNDGIAAHATVLRLRINALGRR